LETFELRVIVRRGDEFLERLPTWTRTEELTLIILLSGIHILLHFQPDLINDLHKLLFTDIALNSLESGS